MHDINVKNCKWVMPTHKLDYVGSRLILLKLFGVWSGITLILLQVNMFETLWPCDNLPFVHFANRGMFIHDK